MKNKIKINVLEHQGFCYGVNQSIKIVNEVLQDKSTPKPIYLLNSIVHNKFVNDYFESKGIVVLEGKPKLELLDEIKCGTVIFSAHGVGDNVKEKALSKGLNIIDATCPFVEKSYQLIKKFLGENYHLLYIGKTNHPEAEAVSSFSNEVTIISEDRINIPNNKDKYAIAHQTTMSYYDVSNVYDKVKEIIPNITVLPMICNATKLRQDELTKALDHISDKTLVIIVGDKKSNNCTKLYELAKRHTKNTLFISSYIDLLNVDLTLYESFVISSGTSTPFKNVNDIKNYIEKNKLPSGKIKLSDYIK